MAIYSVLIEWVQSFFIRKKRPKITRVTAYFESVSGGVPQGCVVGAILFITIIDYLLKDLEER